MSKIMVFILLANFFIFFSCSKSNIETDIRTKQNSGAVRIDSIAEAPLDTVPPDGATNAKKSGVSGDGVTDDTQALQTLINTHTDILLPAGIYIINKTLYMQSGVKIYGRKSAVIKAGNSMSGNLLKMGQYFCFSSVTNSHLINLTFKPSDQPFTLGPWGNACIYIHNSSNIGIEYNVFNFNQPYAVSGSEAVWITGKLSAFNTVSYNNIQSMGIKYAESGSGSSYIFNNKIVNAHSTALCADGNSVQICLNNKVYNNTIINAGHMGIEDWGNVGGSLIKNNTITGTGKSPVERLDGMGISAVGINEKIISNSITDAQMNYIEIGGNHGNIVDSNMIKDTEGKANGIILNYTSPAPANASYYSSVVSYNSINNCKTGISVFGINKPVASINHNIFFNPKFKAIDVDAGNNYTVSITYNSFSFTKPNTNSRIAISSYMVSPGNLTGKNLLITKNNILYSTTAGGGTGIDFGIIIGSNNAVIKDNTINGNSIITGKSKVIAFTSNGVKVGGITLTGNFFTGATVDIQNLDGLIKSSNNF